jgi:hypothetical protein
LVHVELMIALVVRTAGAFVVRYVAAARKSRDGSQP